MVSPARPDAPVLFIPRDCRPAARLQLIDECWSPHKQSGVYLSHKVIKIDGETFDVDSLDFREGNRHLPGEVRERLAGLLPTWDRSREHDRLKRAWDKIVSMLEAERELWEVVTFNINRTRCGALVDETYIMRHERMRDGLSPWPDAPPRRILNEDDDWFDQVVQPQVDAFAVAVRRFRTVDDE